MSALYSKGYFGEDTLAGVYVSQALQACQTYAGEWLDKELIADFRTKLSQTAIPRVEWDQTKDLFEPQHGRYHGRYIDPVVNASNNSSLFLNNRPENDFHG